MASTLFRPAASARPPQSADARRTGSNVAKAAEETVAMGEKLARISPAPTSAPPRNSSGISTTLVSMGKRTRLLVVYHLAVEGSTPWQLRGCLAVGSCSSLHGREFS